MANISFPTTAHKSATSGNSWIFGIFYQPHLNVTKTVHRESSIIGCS